MRLDTTGKVTLDHIYVQNDPRAYFTTLRAMDYSIPHLAAPHFRSLIDRYREQHGRIPTVLDVGCSYGINAMLLAHDLTMDELYVRYGDASAAGLTRRQLIARDRDLVRSRAEAPLARFIGLDSSRPALAYATAAGFLDEAVHADLERHEPTERQQEILREVDLVISTGCIGYVTAKTLLRVIEVAGGRRPQMAHFVLQMFPFAPIAAALAEVGYRSDSVDGLLRQRRFASPQEKAGVLRTLADAGVDPSGQETEDWMFAQLHLCRPIEAGRTLLADPLATSV